MAFLPKVELRQSGWFERVEGGFVRAGHVEILTPSLFHGEALPHLPFAFILRKISAAGSGQPEMLHRYDRVAVRESIAPISPRIADSCRGAPYAS
jgi:hypothetical protein